VLRNALKCTFFIFLNSRSNTPDYCSEGGIKRGASRGEGRKGKEGKKKKGRWRNCLQQVMGDKRKITAIAMKL